MGTIAELLGYSLPDPTPGEDAQAGTGDEGGRAAPEGGDPDAAPVLPRADEAVLAAVLEETSLDPDDAREDLTLSGDLDLDTLGLYAVVSAVERDLGVSFPDADVESWTTLGDMLAAARTSGH